MTTGQGDTGKLQAGQSNFKTRLRDELAQLEDRVAKLDGFIHSDALQALPNPERFRLSQQLAHMRSYRAILIERCEALGVER